MRIFGRIHGEGMTTTTLLAAWQGAPRVAGNVVAWRTTPARAAQQVPFPARVHPALAAALRTLGIASLYLHQTETWEHVQAGRHPIVVTGTASGKTLCYNMPVLDRLLRDPSARALYLFPTKALAQDQLAMLQSLGSALQHIQPGTSLAAATYDGDTSSSLRPTVRDSASIILSNPDMLHMGILPHHPSWDAFFRNLAFVVVDEAHTYRGVFGSHVVNVLRRLKRVARFYGASPQFVLTSATIGNPAELGEALIEEPVVLVDHDASPTGEKHFLIYNPPVVDSALGLRRSMLLEVVQLVSDLLAHDVQSIVFGRARPTVEVMLSYLQGLPERAGPVGVSGRVSSPASIRAYRSGYLPHERREIERGLRDGSVRAVVATTALELGIDVGGMGAALLAGYPGTIAGTWQQAGRAGRGTDTSLAALVASPSPLDQFLARHPDYFFGRSPEHALVNADNLLILLSHLRCAAFELPFHDGEGFGRVDAAQVGEFLQILQASGVLHRSAGRYFWMADRYPAREVSLRSTSPEPVLLQTEVEGQPIAVGQLDEESARWMAHPGAVYLHEGEQYLVEDLDLEAHLARLQPVSLDYYTQARSESTVELVSESARAAMPAAIKTHGEIRVTRKVIGFRKIRWFTHEQLGLGDVDLPPTMLLTCGYWFAPTEATLDKLRDDGMWNNDPIYYGAGWPAQRDAARARDEYRCQVCGAPEGAEQHHVHHKIPFRRFESPERANQLSNLVTLCARCHRQAEQAVRTRSGLAGVAFALGHLAPLLLMCDAGDLNVLADPRSPLVGGSPAVVIYETIPAGIGFSARLYERHDELMAHALELVVSCPCADGCPSCVGPAGEQGMGGKAEALALLRELARTR
jgi:DEAD/DEAH box helicase domain-containing protein